MKRRCKVAATLTLVCCMVFGAISVSAADERLGTIVDGSLLTDETEVTCTTETIARGTYLASGSGRLTLSSYRKLHMSGDTTSHKTVDKIKVQLYLQRLEGESWKTVYTLGPKTAYDTYYVSAGQTYSVAGGHYYRVYGGHTAIKGSTSEAQTSYSNGFWVD